MNDRSHSLGFSGYHKCALRRLAVQCRVPGWDWKDKPEYCLMPARVDEYFCLAETSIINHLCL
jgi:hypothetical protein